MNKIKILVLFLLGFSTVGFAQSKTQQPVSISKSTIVKISPETLQNKSASIQLVDVRTPEEYENGHIKNAININYYGKDFSDRINKLNKDKPIYVYCKSGARSGKSAIILKNLGFKTIYDLKGGILNWDDKNLPLNH